MFKVECTGCNAPYEVDERRDPSRVLTMRCPKCGTSFTVEAPEDPRRTGASAVLGTSGTSPQGAAPEDVPMQPMRSHSALKGTMLGIAPGSISASPARHRPSNTGTLLGVPPPAVASAPPSAG